MYKYFYEIKFVGSDRIRIVCVTTDYIERNTAKAKAKALVFKAFGHDDFEINVASFQTLINRIRFDDDGVEVVNCDLRTKIGEQEIRIDELQKTINEQNDILRSEFN